MQVREEREAGSQEASDEEQVLLRHGAGVQTHVAHAVDGVGSVGGEGGIVIAVALFGVDEAEEGGEGFDCLEDEGVALIRDPSGLFVDLLARPEQIETQTRLGTLDARTVIEHFGIGRLWLVTGPVLDGLDSGSNFLGNGKRPVAVAIAHVDVGAAADPVVEKHAALAVYDLFEMAFVVNAEVRKSRGSRVEDALETGVGILVVASDHPVWNHGPVAVDVEVMIAHGMIVDHEPDLQGEVEEAERCRSFGGRS